VLKLIVFINGVHDMGILLVMSDIATIQVLL